jgi:hypothetical protein
MARPTIQRMFSSRERAFVAQQTAGKPTGAEVEIAGFVIDLVPLTTSQAQQILNILDAIPELTKPAGPGQVQLDVTRMLELVSREGRQVMDLARSVLFRSAKASHMIDAENEGQDVFDEWFDQLDLRSTAAALLPAILKANGLESLMGNAPAPAAANGQAPATSDSTSRKSLDSSAPTTDGASDTSRTS